MSRPQPRAARPWLSRALLALLTLTGLGIWQGAHCLDGPPGDTAVVAAGSDMATTALVAAAGDVVTTTALVAAAGDVVTTTATSERRHSHAVEPRAADACRIAPTMVIAPTAAAVSSPLLPAGERSDAGTPRPLPIARCFPAGVTLTRLGISRT